MLAAPALLLVAVFVGATLHESVHHEKYQHPERTTEIKSCLSPFLVAEEKTTCRFFACVIDAGSTGTRLHLYEFSHDINNDSGPFRVEKETFKEVKPGLSSFAKEPQKAAESVGVLLDAARATIPKSLWIHTPITLKATAGLRLLPDDEADEILDEVDRKVAESGFLTNEDAVGMLSGTDEGVFSWFTLNVLVNRMKHVVSGEFGSAAAALDLGGGSTQLTFIPERPAEAFEDVDEADFSHTINIFGTDVKLYTHSYLGNGLVAARLGVAQDTAGSKGSELRTHCLPKRFTLKDWDYAGSAWRVSGTEEPSFDACLHSAEAYVKERTKVKNVPELSDKDIYVFSYFYDRGVQGGLVPKTEGNLGGLSTVGAYRKAAEKACAVPGEEFGPEHWRPWQCFDLTYIYALLHHGYGLPDDKELFLAKRLKKMEMSWALGASYHLLNSYHADYNIKYTESRRNNPVPTSPEGRPNTTQKPILDDVFEFMSDSLTTVLSYFNLMSASS
ncbi:hypothetical protein QR680_004764 [Steinernema hermaphroditum]|uniref:Uncharacterized protein n=1 Tax=Steinernema hermaphroditum TaxID=289476 RepID=A0AA39HR64_9BILA|nr:hypothetical protein QR680_004764 [Steinernema hermaphroditum]